jgi:hypothetical protein
MKNVAYIHNPNKIHLQFFSIFKIVLISSLVFFLIRSLRNKPIINNNVIISAGALQIVKIMPIHFQLKGVIILFPLMIISCCSNHHKNKIIAPIINKKGAEKHLK